ncbi:MULTISPECIES: cell division protein FtsQ/DivIB [unclassified Moraxella]|uniref:cell division protein FtsQ/DivIB n=1 Tax=unclassified Moraxella TaxID=2685852 RepID=UPI003AF9D111
MTDTLVLSSEASADNHNPKSPYRLLVCVASLLLLGLVVGIGQMVAHLPNANIQINHQGLNSHEYQQLHQVLGQKADRNWLQADLQPYLQRLQRIGWVSQVDIRRDWQQGLLVNVIPRQPVAKFGSEKLVDANGVVFEPANTDELQAHYWMQLQGESHNAVVMMQQVKQVGNWFEPLGLKIDEVIVTPRMAWFFRFNNGLRVLVDNDNTSEKLYRLSVMLQNQLKPQLPKIQTVDLRYKNGMAITWRTAISDGINSPSTNMIGTSRVTTNIDKTKPVNQATAQAQ